MLKFILPVLCSTLLLQTVHAQTPESVQGTTEVQSLSSIFADLKLAAEDRATDHLGFKAVEEGGGRVALVGQFKRSQTFGKFPVRITLRLDPDALVIEVTGLDLPTHPDSSYAHKSRYVRLNLAAYTERFTPGKIRPNRLLDDLVRGVAKGVAVDSAVDCIGSLVRAEF